MKKSHHPIGVGMTPSRTELGKFLRSRRIELGLTQEEVAELSGIRQAVYSRFEIGQSKYLNPKQSDNLARVLKCDPSELRVITPSKPQSQPKTKLARLIYSSRKKLGLSLQGFAERAKISRGHAKLLETKRIGIRYELVEPLSEALGLEPRILLNFVGARKKRTGNKLGELIRSHRKKLYFSLDKLAGMLGISRQILSQMELGWCRLSNNIIVEKLANILKLDAAKMRSLRPKRRLKQKTANTNTLSGFFIINRLKENLTQAELADRVKITQEMVWQIEKGYEDKKIPRSHLDAMEILSKFFKRKKSETANN